MTVPVPTNRPAVEKFLAKKVARARIIFAVDCTASRQPSWDRAAQLQGEMFQAVAGISGLEIQLVYYRGFGECVASRWFDNATALGSIMSGIMCRGGRTQIGRALNHACSENDRQKVAALILISDACEETPADLYEAARKLTTPCFLFQEGTDDRVSGIYAELARLTKGAHCQFNAESARQLGDLLRGVAVFATGGLVALEKQGTTAATLLLTRLTGGDK